MQGTEDIPYKRKLQMQKSSKKQGMCFIKNCDKLKELMKRKVISKDGEVGRNEYTAIKKKKKIEKDIRNPD